MRCLTCSIILLSLVSILVEAQIGIRCYSCTSMSNPKCSEEYYGLESPDAVDCFGTCIKRRGRRGSGDVSTVEITRGCVAQSASGCRDEQWNGIDVRACRCNEDYCNEANQTRVTIATTLLCLFTSIFVFFT